MCMHIYYLALKNIAVAPGELMISPMETAYFQDNVTLSCSSSGGPNNMFQWQQGAVNIINKQQPTLELISVDATDGGEYTCVVSNAAGNDSTSTTLYIRPYFTLQPLNTTTKVDEDHTLTCEAEAFPEPTFEWFHADSEEFGVNVTGMNTGTLMFTPVQFGDEGDYYCTATSNGTGINSSTVTLTGEIVTSLCQDIRLDSTGLLYFRIHNNCLVYWDSIMGFTY